MKRLILWIVYFLLFTLSILLHNSSDYNYKSGQKVRVVGELTAEPQIVSGRQKVILGQFTILADRYPEFHYRDRILAEGVVEPQIVGFLQPKSYLLKTKPAFAPTFAEVSVDKKASAGKSGNLAMKAALWLSGRWNELFAALPSPFDGIMAGVILGRKELLSNTFYQKLKDTGTLHMMVASGTNIALLAGGILPILLIFFKRRNAIYYLIGLIWFYTLMTGLSSPIIRASTLASLIYISSIVGREANGGRMLLLTGGALLLINPFWISDIGFQLSFLATAGLVWVAPKLQSVIPAFIYKEDKSEILNPKYETKYTKSKIQMFKTLEFEKFGFVSNFVLRISNLFCKLLSTESFSSSIACQLATLPILIGAFGQINLLSPLVNLLVLWTIPYLLSGGLLAGVLFLIWPSLAKLALYLLYPLLFYLEQTINLFAKVKITMVEMPRMGWPLAAVYYLILWFWVKKDLRGLRADSRGYLRKSA